MSLSDRLLELRKKKNLSQEDVADILGVSRQTISKWETGLSTPEFDKIEPLAKLFEVSVDELVTGNKIEKDKEIKEEITINRHSTKSVVLLIIGIFLYFLAIIDLIVLDEMGLPDFVVASSFIFICAVATCLLIFRSMIFTKEKLKMMEKTTKINNQKYKITEKLISTIILLIYLIVSFVTCAWHITWIIWVIYALVMEIVKLIFLVKGYEVGDDDNED